MLVYRVIQDQDDILGPAFRSRTFAVDQNSGLRTSTLVNLKSSPMHAVAVLYVHGYTDYFFQTELAHHWGNHGYAFYALDLAGFGRSQRSNIRSNWCTDVSEYHSDLQVALQEIQGDGYHSVILLGHSTGALICCDFLLTGNDRGTVDKLILNSPFLALPFAPDRLNTMEPLLKWLTAALPAVSLKNTQPSLYAKSLHQTFCGEWSYRLDWKPASGFPLSFQWLNAIIRAQQGLSDSILALPTLLCRSATSTYQAKTVSEMRAGDGVLDVNSMEKRARNLFSNLTIEVFDGGYHDLSLSPPAVRKHYLDSSVEWAS